MLVDGIGQNFSLWLWVPACAETTDGEWRSRQTVSTVIAERSEAIHREAKQKAGLLRCARNDDINGHTSRATHTSAFSRRECVRGVREFIRRSHEKGVGNAGCRRTRSLACKVKKHTS